MRIVVAKGPTAIVNVRPACAAKEDRAHVSRASTRFASVVGMAPGSKRTPGSSLCVLLDSGEQPA